MLDLKWLAIPLEPSLQERMECQARAASELITDPALTDVERAAYQAAIQSVLTSLRAASASVSDLAVEYYADRAGWLSRAAAASVDIRRATRLSPVVVLDAAVCERLRELSDPGTA